MDIFTAVIIVIVLMNGFLFVIFKGIVINVGKLAQNNAVRQLSLYDNLIEKKEQKLHQLHKAAANERLQISKDNAHRWKGDRRLAINPFAIPEGDYLDGQFFHKYQAIRDFFGFDRLQCIKDVLEQYGTEEQDRYASLVKQILARFPLEERFNLSTLEEQDQLQILEEILNDEEYGLLEEYQTLYWPFDCLEFFDWLEAEAYRCEPGIVVRTDRREDDFKEIDSRIKTQYDGSICEGIQIIMQNMLYDFSIHKREISG